ncbi:MAG: vWA domain-containing protein, partial [Treponema sp.]
MKQVRKQAAITVYLFIIWVVGAQVHNVGGADVVVLMDTSGTILPYYQIINDQVLHSIVTRFVRKGDTFHLLSFSAKPCYEMSQTIITEADLSRVVSRFMLLYQLGSSADFLAGLHFAGAYMKGLPPRPKTMIIISDGIFNPPPDSPYRRYTDEHIKTEIAKITADIRSNKWAVYYVKLPFPQNAPVKALDGSFYAGRHIKNGRDRTMRTAEAAASAAAEAAVGVPAFGLPRLDRQDEPPAAQNTLSPFPPPKTSVP